VLDARSKELAAGSSKVRFPAQVLMRSGGLNAALMGPKIISIRREFSVSRCPKSCN
jgi:hypothetical protein